LLANEYRVSTTKFAEKRASVTELEKELGPATKGGDHSGDHVLGSGEDIPRCEAQDPVVFQSEVVLLASVVSEGHAIGVVLLSIEGDHEIDLSIGEIHSGYQLAASLDNPHLWLWEVDASREEDAEELVFELALSDVGPTEAHYQHFAHRSHSIPTAPGNSMEHVRHLSGCGEFPPFGFIKTSGGHTFSPRYRDVD
jgi:hypothetical protein